MYKLLKKHGIYYTSATFNVTNSEKLFLVRFSSVFLQAPSSVNLTLMKQVLVIFLEENSRTYVVLSSKAGLNHSREKDTIYKYNFNFEQFFHYFTNRR